MVVNVSFLVEWYLHLTAFDPDIEVWSDASGSWCSMAFALAASSVGVSVDRVVWWQQQSGVPNGVVPRYAFTVTIWQSSRF